jgi:hypothetical protein
MAFGEDIVGFGQLTGENFAIPVDYRLTVRQGWISDGAGGRLPGRRSVDGFVTASDAVSLHGAYQDGLKLVLELEDGRRLPCFLQAFENPTARIVARGDLTALP